MHCRNGVGRDESSRDVYITVFRESNPAAKLAKTRLVIISHLLRYPCLFEPCLFEQQNKSKPLWEACVLIWSWSLYSLCNTFEIIWKWFFRLDNEIPRCLVLRNIISKTCHIHSQAFFLLPFWYKLNSIFFFVIDNKIPKKECLCSLYHISVKKGRGHGRSVF